MNNVVERIRGGTLLPPEVCAVLVASVVYIGLFAHQAVATQLTYGNSLVLEESTAGIWQYVREGMTVLLAGLLLLGTARDKLVRHGHVTISVGVLIVGVYVGLQAVRVIIDPNLPDVYALLGLRVFYLAAIAAAVARYGADDRSTLLKWLAWMLVPMLLIETYIAVQQILNGSGVLGTTALGSRPWGTYSSANNLGLAILGITLILVLSRIHLWWLFAGIAMIVCYASGSRTTILALGLVIAGLLVSRLRLRVLLLPLGIFVLLISYLAVSSQGVSGRVIRSEGRLEVWRSTLSTIQGPWELIFGAGLGVGTNAATVLLGGAQLTAPAIVDSTIISAMLSLGAVGLTIFLAALVHVAHRTTFERRLVVLPALVMAALMFNLPELSPTNLLGSIAIGVSLRLRPAPQKVHTSQPPVALRSRSQLEPGTVAASHHGHVRRPG
jgi:hypothetical protein